jgi:protein-disulfide isomerase
MSRRRAIVAATLISASALLSGLLSGAARSDIIEGNPASLVRVTIYEDLASADCARLRTMLDEKFLPKYGRRVAFVHRDFPLGRHEWALEAALAGRWTWEQSGGIGLTYRRELLSEQDHITLPAFKDWLRQFARRHSLDENAIVAALDDKRLRAEVDSDIQGGSARGVTKVPSVYLGAQSFIENVIFDEVARAIDAALER